MTASNVVLFPAISSPPATEQLDIKIDPHPRYTTYTGTRDDLIAAGIAKLDMFPVLPKRMKYTDDHHRVVRIRGGRFEVTVWPAGAEDIFKEFLCEQAQALFTWLMMQASNPAAFEEWLQTSIYAKHDDADYTLSKSGKRQLLRVQQALLREICLADINRH